MKDKLSALLDGDLDEHSMRPVFDAIRRDRSLRTDWETYCMIGDVLRGDRDTAPGLVERVMADIETEPTVLAPPAPVSVARPGGWRSLMPLAASVMGVAAVGWVALNLYAEPDEVSRVVSAAGAIQVAEKVSVQALPAAPQVDRHREYVFAHQAMTAGGPLSGVIQHVRAVSDVRQDAGR